MEKVMKLGTAVLCFAVMLAFVSCGGAKGAAEKLGDEIVKTGMFPDGSVTNYGIYNAFSQQVKDDLTGKWGLLQALPGKGHFEVTGGVCKVIIDSPGSATYMVQLCYFPCPIKFGKPFKVSFDAKADSPRKIEMKVGRIAGDWLAYSGNKTYDLTTDWQTFSFVFKSLGTDDSARFEFECANDKPSMYFRNVSMKPVLE